MRHIPYATQWIDDDDIAAVASVLRSSNLTQGPAVEEFEHAVAAYCGARYAVAVNSGTSALHIACLAAGIGAGDEVITSPNTFAASANCVLYCGGTPVFADISPDTAIIDPARIAEKITPRTKAIIPVDFAGHPADMEAVHALAQKHGLLVISDAAHSLGGAYADRTGAAVKVGSCRHADMTILSFHPVKLITSGEGGMVLTNDAALYEKLVLFRSHGITRDPKYMKESHGTWYYEMHALGFNYRLTDIQAALGTSQLRRLDSFVERRIELARRYDAAFQGTAVGFLRRCPEVRSAYHLYVINVPDRRKVFDRLRAAGIVVNVHYLPVYRHPYYQAHGYRNVQCPNAEAYYAGAISIPMYPKLSNEDQDYVIAAVKEAVDAR